MTDGSSNYSAIIKILIDQAQVQGEIGKISHSLKPINLDINLATASAKEQIKQIEASLSSVGDKVSTKTLLDKDGIKQYSVGVEHVASGLKTTSTYIANINKEGEVSVRQIDQVKSATSELNVLEKQQYETFVAKGKVQKENLKSLDSSISSSEKLTTKIGTMQNELDSLRVNNVDAFKNPEIAKMGNEVQGLINNFDGSKKAVGEFSVANGQLKNKLTEVNNSFRSTTSSADNFGTTLLKDIKKVAEWMVATTLIIGALQQIREGIQYIEDLNKAMTNIGMVTGQTADQLGGMVTQFNSMARELGVDTLAIAEGAGEWIRQGKSAAETTDLLRSSTMMSKLGNLEAADATDKLIAVTNAYNISAKDSIQVVDTLIGLDNYKIVAYDSNII